MPERVERIYMGSYDPVYDVEDIQEGAIDGGFVALATVLAFVGIIVLFGVFSWGWTKIKGAK